jgi:hypothetical protein
MILLNYIIQVLAGPDERLSGQDAFGLQFGDGLMGRLTAIERDLLRDIMIADRFHEEAYGGRSTSVLSQQEVYSLTFLIDRGRDSAIDPSLLYRFHRLSRMSRLGAHISSTVSRRRERSVDTAG